MKYVNISNEKYKVFAYIKTMCKEIEQTFNEKLLALDPNNLIFEARKYSINIERAENLEALESMNKHNQKSKFLDIDNKIESTIKSKQQKGLWIPPRYNR